MLQTPPRVFAPFLVPILALWLSPGLCAQSTNGGAISEPPRSAPSLKLAYPDSPAGLEHLLKDILQAQKENDGAKAEALLQGFILPNPAAWYEATFGSVIARNEGALYESAQSSVAPTLGRDLLNVLHMKLEDVHVERFDKSCDDNAGEDTFGILHARVQPAPLYEARFFKGNKFVRISSFAYVDGGFRFVIQPKLEGEVFALVRQKDPSAGATPTPGGVGSLILELS